MNKSMRLSEMAGISRSHDDRLADAGGGSFWPLNLALALLGAAILTVAFYFLDPQDPRIGRNPWTYAIITPIALLICSALLHRWVSRVVEKTMQVAFLLSVLIHLLLIIYAVNIVIFSRMWPDVLDTLAAQREQLKREQLQAKQYHRLSANNTTGERPDYLSYIPTEHQPTETEQATSPALQLAQSEAADLASPVPEMELTATPHLLKRQQPQRTSPAVSQDAASLSRSDALPARQVDSAAQLPVPEIPVDEPAPLRPATATPASRRATAAALAQPALPSSTPDNALAGSMAMPRAARESELPATAPQPNRPTTAAVASAQPSTNRRLEVPAMPSASPAEQVSESQAAAVAKRLATADATGTLSLPANAPAAIANSTIQPRNATPGPRREVPYRVPSPSAGDSRVAIARDTGGGTVGPLAANSMPVRGPESIAASGSSGGELRAATRELPRRSTRSSPPSAALPEIGQPQSATWNGVASLAGGIAGTSPAQLSQAAASGEAMTQDVAQLAGAGGAIDRAAPGIMGPPGSLSIPAASAVAAEANQPSDRSGANAEPGLGLASSSTIGRRTASPSGPLPPTFPGDPTGSVGEPSDAVRLPAGLRRADTWQAVTPSLTEALVDGPPRDGDTAPTSTLPSSTTVEVPGDVIARLSADDTTSQDLSASGNLPPTQRATGRESLAAPVPLHVDGLPGPGGLSPTPTLLGAVLPKRRDLRDNNLPPQLDSQRFTQPEVGGPLAAGRDVALPRPAFQQRLERLQDQALAGDLSREPQTEQAIERGLEFLARHQRPDGSWRLQDFDTQVLMRSDTAATGLALLAFQGAGYTHKQFKYADTVQRAIDFLAAHQADNGDLYIPQDPASDRNAWLYSHGIAALAVCEAYGMTQDDDLRPLAQGAIDFMVTSQDTTRGGWRYRPGVGTDTSVTGWFMMAFKSGQLAGLDVPKQTFVHIEKYLDLSQASATQAYLYRYNPYASDTPQQRHGLQPTPIMTSVGLLMRLYFGWQRERPEMMLGADHLLGHPPRHGTRDATSRDTYYWYYATQVLFHMGGDRWQRWHDELYPLLIDSQIVEGDDAGSWDPQSPTPDLWAAYGGRLYVTTMNLLSLEVSYRHLPLYEATAE